MFTFADRPEFLSEMVDQLIAHPKIDEMINQLSSVLATIHETNPATFRERALSALAVGAVHVIHASASNLRVFASAVEQDVAVIQAYGGYPDPVAKRGAIYAIAYMGKFTELRQSLKEAALSIHAGGDPVIASELVDAFGVYGVPLTDLTREEATVLAMEFLHVDDWEFGQAALPRFLNSFVKLFPDETYDLLLKRIERTVQAPTVVRVFGLTRELISFDGVPTEKRTQLGQDCIGRLLTDESVEELAQLFWIVAGYGEASFDLITATSSNMDDRSIRNLVFLIDNARRNLVLTNPAFAKNVLRSLTGDERQRIVRALAYQASRSQADSYTGIGLADDLEDERSRFRERVTTFPEEPGFEDLTQALRSST